MKVLQLCKYFPPEWGGIEKVSFDLVHDLSKKDIKIDSLAFCSKGANRVERIFGNRLIRCRTILKLASTPFSLTYFMIFIKINRQYDIIHVHLPNPLALILISIFAKRFKGKIIIHWHSDIVSQKLLYRLIKPFETLTLRRATKIIATSTNYLQNSKPLSKFLFKCEVIPLGIEHDDYKLVESEFKKVTEEFSGLFVILAVGRLVSYKGFQYLINSASVLPKDCIIVIVGQGPLKSSLNKLICQNKLEGKVILKGKLDSTELNALYKRANIFCLPSIERSEAFGVVLMEAMIHRCALIATNIKGSGVNFVNKHQYSGINVDPRNSAAIASAIIELKENPELLRKYSEHAFDRGVSTFSRRTMTDKIINLFKGISSPGVKA